MLYIVLLAPSEDGLKYLVVIVFGIYIVYSIWICNDIILYYFYLHQYIRLPIIQGNLGYHNHGIYIRFAI